MKPGRRPTKKGPNTALGPFLKNLAEARELADLIRDHLDEHMGVTPEEVHWGHVGDAAHTIEMLRDVAVACNLITEE